MAIKMISNPLIEPYATDGCGLNKILWSLLLWCILTMGFNSCKISECRKAEEAMYAKYRYSLANDSLSDMGSELSFDCNHRYTRKYIRKHLGKPLRIYIHDDHSMGTDLYEEWIYIGRQQKYPNEKPWIGSLLILSFYINKPGMIEQGHGCPEPYCHLYSTMNFSDDIYTNLILRFNSDSFDIKYPYMGSAINKRLIKRLSLHL